MHETRRWISVGVGSLFFGSSSCATAYAKALRVSSAIWRRGLEVSETRALLAVDKGSSGSRSVVCRAQINRRIRLI